MVRFHTGIGFLGGSESGVELEVEAEEEGEMAGGFGGDEEAEFVVDNCLVGLLGSGLNLGGFCRLFGGISIVSRLPGVGRGRELDRMGT